jgi:hypothetical protein
MIEMTREYNTLAHYAPEIVEEGHVRILVAVVVKPGSHTGNLQDARGDLKGKRKQAPNGRDAE